MKTPLELATELLKISPRFAKAQLREIRKRMRYEEKANAAFVAATAPGYTERTLHLADEYAARRTKSPEEQSLLAKQELYSALLEIKPALVENADAALIAKKEFASTLSAAKRFNASTQEILDAKKIAQAYVQNIGRFASTKGAALKKRLSPIESALKKELKSLEEIGIDLKFHPSSKREKALVSSTKATALSALSSLELEEQLSSLSKEDLNAIKAAALKLLKLSKKETL